MASPARGASPDLSPDESLVLDTNTSAGGHRRSNCDVVVGRGEKKISLSNAKTWSCSGYSRCSYRKSCFRDEIGVEGFLHLNM